MALKHAQAGEVVDLRPLGDSPADARTGAIVRTPSFETVRLVVLAGTEIPTHKGAGPDHAPLHRGARRARASGGPVEIGAGDWLYLEGNEPHSVRDVEDAYLLLTILFDA